MQHGHEWKDTNVCGFDFHGQPVSYTVRTPGKCKLSHAPWVSSPYAELVASFVAEAKQARAQQRRVLASPSRLTCRSLDQFAWSLATCYINERSLLEELGPNTIDRSTGRKHTDDHGDDTDTDARLEELGPKTIKERSLLEELGPNTIDRSIDREGAQTTTATIPTQTLGNPCHRSPVVHR